MTALIVHCTVPDDATAERIAQALVAGGLAACVNCVAGVRSTYLWQGAVHCDEERLLLIKTRRGRFDAVARRIRELHPYELPEVIAVDVALGDAAYLAWLAQSSSAP